MFFNLNRGAAGTGATGADAPVNFWARVRRTRPENKSNNRSSLRTAFEAINGSYLLVSISCFYLWDVETTNRA